MDVIENEIEKFAKKYEERLHHVNVEAIHLLDNNELVRRLKKNLAGLVITKNRAHCSAP